jgi:hypothetical protein
MVVQPISGGFDIKYLPQGAIPQIEGPAGVPMLPSPQDVNPESLLQGVSDGEIAIGVDAQFIPFRVIWKKLKAVLILGLQDGGKSNTAIWLLSQVLLQGGRLAVIDKHARSEEDSLYQKIQPYEGVFDVPVGDIPASAMRAIGHVAKVLKARMAGAKCDYPLLLIVDEFTAIMRQMGTEREWGQVADTLLEVIGDCNYEGRKHKVYCICIGQASNASSTGGTEIRDTFNTVIVHRMKEKQASMLSMTEEKKQIARLGKGETFIDIEGSDIQYVRIPYVDDAFIAHVARSVGCSEGVLSGFQGRSGDVVESDTNGPSGLSERYIGLSERDEKVKRVLTLREIGLGKEAIINEIWSARKGGGPKYRQAESEYNEIMGVLNED